MDLALVLKRPIITEKSLAAISFDGYTFEVNRKANKNQIIEAVEKLYKVKVIDVRVLNQKGKIRRYGKLRKNTKLSDRKKAIVILKKGDKIPLFEEVTQQLESK